MLVIYKELKNNKLEFTKEEFEQYLMQAKQEGYEDGYKAGSNIIYKTIPTIPPTITPQPFIPNWTSSEDIPVVKNQNNIKVDGISYE